MKKLLILLCLMLPGTAGATIRTWTADTTLPKELVTANDTINIVADLYSNTYGIAIRTTGVVIKGNGHKIFYGRGGGSSDPNHGTGGGYAATNEGIYLSYNAHRIKFRDLSIIHDPQADGDDLDTAFNGSYDVGVQFINNDSITFINCNFKVFGNDVSCMDQYGLGSSSRTYIDSCHFWNYSDTYATRASYGGAAIRFQYRSNSYWACKIYRSVVHIASHASIAVIGKADVNQYGRGVEIKYCSTYTDAVNKNGGTPQTGDCSHLQYNSCDNAYGIILKDLTSPVDVAYNYISNGTVNSGSRGLLMENTKGTVSDSIKVHHNTIVATSGPTEENCDGVYRGIRMRAIDNGGMLDYFHVYNNYVQTLTDTKSSTWHIGKEASALQLSLDSRSQGGGHGLIENNYVVARSMNEWDGNQSHRTKAAEYCVFNDFTGTYTVTIRNNHYISGDNPVAFSDRYNVGSAHDLICYGDTLGFLPAGDSGINQYGRSAWRVGEYGEPSTNLYALNCYYDTATGARDTNIILNSSSTHQFTLKQRIPMTIMGTNNLLVENTTLRIVNKYNQTVLNQTITDGDTTFDFRYFYTYGNNAGTDSNFNPFDIIAKKGSDSVIWNDSVIDWRRTCINLRLPATAGTLAGDTCIPEVPPSCPDVVLTGPANGSSIPHTYVTFQAAFTQDDQDNSYTASLQVDAGDPTPDSNVYSGLFNSDQPNWSTLVDSLKEDVTYYWQILLVDGDCTDSSPVRWFTIDSVAGDLCPNVTLVSPASGITIGTKNQTLVASFTDDDAGQDMIVRVYGNKGTTPPTTLRHTDTLTQDSSNWFWNWSGLGEDTVHYWRIIVTDSSCADTSAIRWFLVDSLQATGNVIRKINVRGVKIGDANGEQGYPISDSVLPVWAACVSVHGGGNQLFYGELR